MSETKKRLYKGSTVAKKLEELLQRVENINTCKDGTYEYVYYVKKIIVFGSYVDVINKEKDSVHDLDIGYELGLKEQYKEYNNLQLAKERRCTLPRNANSLMYFIWPEEEVLRYLKNKCGIYSFHPLSDEDEHKIIMGSKYIVAYDIDKEGEKDRLRTLLEEEKAKLKFVFE